MCCVSSGNMVNPDVLEFKEGKIGMACEVKVGVNLGRVEGDGYECLDAFNFIEEVKVCGGGCDGAVGGVRTG